MLKSLIGVPKHGGTQVASCAGGEEPFVRFLAIETATMGGLPEERLTVGTDDVVFRIATDVDGYTSHNVSHLTRSCRGFPSPAVRPIMNSQTVTLTTDGRTATYSVLCVDVISGTYAEPDRGVLTVLELLVF